MSDKTNTLTVHDATYNLLRKLGLTTIFGNPGSTEQPFLKNFPSDFEYVLGLQEATAVAMADGFAQATGKPALLNLHTSAGTGNGMGNIIGAFQNKTPTSTVHLRHSRSAHVLVRSVWKQGGELRQSRLHRLPLSGFLRMAMRARGF